MAPYTHVTLYLAAYPTQNAVAEIIERTHTHMRRYAIYRENRKSGKSGDSAHTHILKMQKVNDCAGKSH